MSQHKVERIKPGYFKRSYPIPETGLELRNFPAWIVDFDGDVRKGVVQLSSGNEFYICLDFRVVYENELHRTKKAAMAAAKAMKGRRTVIPNHGS